MLDSFYEKLEGWLNSDDYKLRVEEEKRILPKLKQFLSRFTLDFIKNMSIDDYVQGKHNKQSFCDYIENTLSEFCGISGYGASQMFTIYYSKERGSYLVYKEQQKVLRGVSIDYNAVFEKVRTSLVEIITASVNNDYDTIASNTYLYPQLKNKIAYLYSVDTQIPINSQNDLDLLITLLGLEQDKNEDTTYKRKKIYDFYSKYVRPKYPEISTLLFMKFLYSGEGYRLYLRGKEKSIIESKEIVNYQLKDITVDEVFKIKRTGNGTSKRVTYQPGSEESKRITGRKGEDIVVEFLKKHKKEMNIEKIDTWCFGENQDDGRGYDISYTTKDGTEVFVEVKATKADLKDKVYFEMSDNELSVMIEHKDNYYIYFVNNVNKGKVISRILGRDFLEKDCIQPIKYRVNFSGKEKLGDGSINCYN